MRVTARITVLCSSLACLASLSLCQAVAPSAPGLPNIHPGYAQRAQVKVDSVPAGFSINALTLDATTGEVIEGAFGKASVKERLNASSPSLSGIANED